MKKTITFRQNALVGAPGMSSGFTPSIPNAFKISVSLRGVDIKIYGFTGSQWELLYNTDGLINSYTTEVVHQKYYFESKTGAEQVVRASFLSSDTRDIDQPRFGVSKETRKLHDIDEVPIYTSSDDGKLLTVRSDGSLAWLGLNESYVVEVIGTGDGGGGSSSTPTGVGTFLEEFTMFGGGTVTDGVLSTSAATPSYYKKSGMVAPSTTATTAVFSMWFNPEQSQMGLYSDQHYPLQVDFGLKMFSSSQLRISTPIGAGNGVTLSTPLTLNEWHHALVTVETDIAYTSTSSKSMTVKLFIDGQEVYTKTGNSSSKRIRAYAGISTGTKHYIGAENYNGSVSYKGNGQFDFMEWVDDVTLSDAQILAMYNSGTRGWSVADAAAYEEEQSGGGNVIAGTFLEDISTVIARQPSKISSGIYTDNSHGGSIGMSVLLKDDGILAYDPNTNETVNDEFTISWWMNLDASQAASNLGLAGINVGQVSGVVRRFAFDLGNGSALIDPHFISYTRNPKTTNNLNTGVSMAGVWTHVAIVIKNDGSNTVGSIYLNGSKLNNGFSYPLGTKVFPPSTHQEFMFGAGFQSSSVKGQFDSMQIADGTALTDSQVAAIAGQADRQMSIETAAGGGEAPSAGSIVGLEESAGLTLHGNAQLIDGVLHVDGTNGTYASLPHSTDYDRESGDLSISMWFKANSLPNNWNAALVSKMGTGWDGYIAAISTMAADDGSGNMTSGGLQTTSWVGGSNPTANNRAAPSGGISLNTWHHVTYVMPATGDYKMYFNGVEVHSYVPTARNTSTSGELRIGAWFNGSYSGYFNGQIDGLSFTKSVKSAQDIHDEYTGGIGTSDSSSYLESSATLYGDANLSNGSLVLDGTGDYAVIDDGFRFTDKMTTSVWFKTTATGDRRIYSSHVRGLSGGDFRNGFFARLNDGQLKYRHPAGGTGELTGPSGLNDGAWHHLALSWEASVGYTLYVDGVQAGSGGSSVSDGYVSGWGLYIGANPWNNNDPYALFEGEIKKFEVLNEVLTSQQVTDRFNEG